MVVTVVSNDDDNDKYDFKDDAYDEAEDHAYEDDGVNATQYHYDHYMIIEQRRLSL